MIEPLGEQLHVGGVGGLSVCTWKPWFMTCGRQDHTVKLWDHERRVLLLSAWYPDDDVLDVALHPTGLHAVLAFRGRVVFVTLHGPVDELMLRPSIEIAGGGDLVCFSEAGHKFAVVDGPEVHVYCAITFRSLFDIAAHGARVSSTTEIMGKRYYYEVGDTTGTTRFSAFPSHLSSESLDTCEYKCLLPYLGLHASYLLSEAQ